LEVVFMIESFMYFAIGFFLAILSVLVVAFFVHRRAVRLTMRRFEHHPAVGGGSSRRQGSIAR
jgi:hypothetical protein